MLTTNALSIHCQIYVVVFYDSSIFFISFGIHGPTTAILLFSKVVPRVIAAFPINSWISTVYRLPYHVSKVVPPLISALHCELYSLLFTLVPYEKTLRESVSSLSSHIRTASSFVWASTLNRRLSNKCARRKTLAQILLCSLGVSVDHSTLESQTLQNASLNPPQ